MIKSTQLGALFIMQNNLYRGAALILLSEVFLVVSGMIIKQVSGNLPTEMIVFFRNLFGLALLTPWLLRNGRKAIGTELLRFHLVRALVGVSAMTCLYYTWGHLPLAQAALLKQTAPFFIPLIGFWWLGERINRYSKMAIFVGFAGVYAILNPHENTLNIAVLVGVCGAILSALAKVTIRRMSATESPQRIVFYFALFSSILSFIPALLSWQLHTLIQALWLTSLAITSTVAQLLLSKGYGFAPASQLGPFTYGSVAFAALFGWLLWNELLSVNTWIGMVLITLAGLMAMMKDKRHAE
jgi:drug/metabolite transporter (DMT)-like permease